MLRVIMGPAPVCWLRCAPGWAPAAGKWGASGLSMAAGRGVSAVQWPAASQAETTRAGPATVATAHTVLHRSADTMGDGFRCPVAVARADENRGGLRCRADARDTVRPLIGRRDYARLPPGCWPRLVLRPVACGRGAVQGDGITKGDGRHARWVLPVHQAALQASIAKGNHQKRQV